MARILVVDDDPLIIQLVSHKLNHRGFEVLIAEDGHEALERVHSTHPDLIILDAMMPGLDGFAVLRQLKSHPETAGIPVLMLTARKTEQDIVSGLSQGAADYLIKPFMPEELVSRVRRLLGSRSGAP